MCVPASCWRPHGRTRPERFPPSSARLGPTGRSPLRPRSWWTPARPAVCWVRGWPAGGWGTAGSETAGPGDGWRRTAGWGSEPWRSADSPAEGWWGWTPGRGADRGAERDRGPDCCGTGAPGTGTARPCCPGWAADWSWGGWFRVEKDQTDCPSQLQVDTKKMKRVNKQSLACLNKSCWWC